MKVRLTAKLLIPLSILVITGLMASILVAYFSAKKGLETAVTEQVMQQSESMADKINTWMARNQIESQRVKCSQLIAGTKCAHRAPATPAKAEQRAKASSLYAARFTPITSAAMSLSRMATQARPSLDLTKFVAA